MQTINVKFTRVVCYFSLIIYVYVNYNAQMFHMILLHAMERKKDFILPIS